MSSYWYLMSFFSDVVEFIQIFLEFWALCSVLVTTNIDSYFFDASGILSVCNYCQFHPCFNIIWCWPAVA